MQQKEPLELISKLFEVIKSDMLYKQWLAHALYLELIQQKEPLELIFKNQEVRYLTKPCCRNMGWPWQFTWSSIIRRNLWSSSSSSVRFMGSRQNKIVLLVLPQNDLGIRRRILEMRSIIHFIPFSVLLYG
jgi:hypothetical protein